MKPEDRIKMLLVGGLLFVVVLGAGAFMFNSQLLGPRNQRLAVLRDENSKNDLSVSEITNAIPRLKEMQKLSLPPDAAVAQQKYGEELEKMLQFSLFGKDKYQVTPKSLEDRSKLPPSKRPPIMKLSFTVVAHGELMSIVDFLDRFYRLPLLHRISNFHISRPLTVGPGQRQTELDFSITVEALIVDGAEKRDTLLPKGIAPPQRLARSTLSQYQSIAGRNIFFGPLNTGASSMDVNVDDFDEKEFVKLTEITHCEKGTWACLYDQANNYDYTITQKADGSFNVDVIKSKKVPLRATKDLEIRNEHGETLAKFKIVRIDATAVILEKNDQYYRLNAGWSIKDLDRSKPLSAEEAKELGLPPLAKKADKDAKEEKKDGKPEDKPAKDGKPENNSKPPVKIDVKTEIPTNGEKK
ncbi:MAG TPA: hypothetical protein VGZ47_06210 [Gemmataceae bacterium]|nr:hypothetical protein [Gemmataceae bacterium]